MIPVFKNIIYAVDIEVRPLPEYDQKTRKISKTDNEEEKEEMVDNPNFLPWCSEIYGLGVAWGGDFETESAYFTGEDIPRVVKILSENKLQLIAHNVFYDWVNLHYKFEVVLNFVGDTGVVSQCINNSDFITSFGLKQTTQRLYNIETQDIEIKSYLRAHHKIAASKYGAYIHLCPTEIIEKYCRWDVIYCWRIFNDKEKWIKSDISIYMKLYINEVKLTIQQFLEGILIDREGMSIEKDKLGKEIQAIEEKFLNHPALVDHIYNVQVDKFNKLQSTYKKKVLDFDLWMSENKFNINSTSQLKQLFDSQKLHWCEKEHRFIYPFLNTFPNTKINNPDSPKLGTKFLHAYGIGGEILADKGEKITLCQHLERALDESFLTGRVHPQLNLLGTASGRISGSGVNIVAAPISDERYGKYLVVEEGWSILAKDIKSLEPTLLACLSNDPILKYTCYEGEGKKPFIRDGVLWIDDNYLMACYSAPFMRTELESKIDLDNWVNDSDAEKKKVKLTRTVGKTIVLATNYGASSLKIQNTIREQLKLNIPVKDIKIFQENYWATLSVAANYKRNIEMEVRERGYLINIGGFPLTFYDRPNGIIKGEHKALNRMLQSSAAVCMKLLLFYVHENLKGRPDVKPQVCDLHDALFFKVKDESVDIVNSLIEEALEKVNKTLCLPLNLRLDKHAGKNFYECK